MPFRRLFVLWHSLIRSLYFIYTSDTFRPILALFTHFTLHQFFLVYINYHAKYFSYPWWRCRSELIIIFNFSSQRPHLNYTFIVLLQWNFPRNISVAHIYQQSFKPCCDCLIKVKALNVPKLLFWTWVPSFSFAESILTSKIMKKISRISEYAHSTKDKRIRLVGTCRKVPLVLTCLLYTSDAADE